MKFNTGRENYNIITVSSICYHAKRFGRSEERRDRAKISLASQRDRQQSKLF